MHIIIIIIIIIYVFLSSLFLFTPLFHFLFSLSCFFRAFTSLSLPIILSISRHIITIFSAILVQLWVEITHWKKKQEKELLKEIKHSMQI
jgi:hypothetical protein